MRLGDSLRLCWTLPVPPALEHHPACSISEDQNHKYPENGLPSFSGCQRTKKHKSNDSHRTENRKSNPKSYQMLCHWASHKTKLLDLNRTCGERVRAWPVFSACDVSSIPFRAALIHRATQTESCPVPRQTSEIRMAHSAQFSCDPCYHCFTQKDSVLARQLAEAGCRSLCKTQ